MRPVLVRQPDGTPKNDGSHQMRLITYAGWNRFIATRINYESQGTVEAKLVGAKLVVNDPALSTMAGKADVWLPIRPPTCSLPCCATSWSTTILETAPGATSTGRSRTRARSGASFSLPSSPRGTRRTPSHRAQLFRLGVGRPAHRHPYGADR